MVIDPQRDTDRVESAAREAGVTITHVAETQYASVSRLAHEAEHDAALFPTHGFGSCCSSGPETGAGASTIGEQLAVNHALTDPDEEHFVRDLIANLTAYPSCYAHMSPANSQGPGPANLQVPESLDATELTRRLADGEWVIDLRNRVAFSSNHLQGGAVSFEYGNGSNFTTYLGWVLPWDEQLTLVGAHADVEDAIRDLSRIGIGSPDAAIGTEPHALALDAPVASYPRVGWEETDVRFHGSGNRQRGAGCRRRPEPPRRDPDRRFRLHLDSRRAPAHVGRRTTLDSNKNGRATVTRTTAREALDQPSGRS